VLSDDSRFEIVGLAAQRPRRGWSLPNACARDVVVMDIEMPLCDGVEATRLLQEAAPEVQVVAISGHNYEGARLEIREAGAVDYVRKSRIDDDLVAVLEALVVALQNRY